VIGALVATEVKYPQLAVAAHGDTATHAVPFHCKMSPLLGVNGDAIGVPCSWLAFQIALVFCAATVNAVPLAVTVIPVPAAKSFHTGGVPAPALTKI
jgi:hypothetical protein